MDRIHGRVYVIPKGKSQINARYKAVRTIMVMPPDHEVQYLETAVSYPIKGRQRNRDLSFGDDRF